jgi:O-antigen ligase
VAGVFCVLGILLTVSRGGLIALTASLLAALFLAGRWRPLAFIAAAVIACSSFYYFAVLAPPAATERLELTSQGETQLKEGRTTLWQVAARIVEAKPITGVGAGNFQTSSRHYLLQPGALGRPDLIIEKPLVVHNTYLGIAAEDGLVGLGLFIVIVLFCLGSAWRAVRHFMAVGDRGGEALARGLTIGLIGIIVADTFISEEYSKVLWLLLGLGPALLSVAKAEVARRRHSEEAAADYEPGPPPLAAQSSS